MIKQAKSYPDWRDNIGLAVVEQRDSESLSILAPRNLTVGPNGSASFQLRRQGWSLAKDVAGCPYPCYWSAPGPIPATVVWRFDTPMTGEYAVFIQYGDLGRPQAKKAIYTVRFKGGTLSFPIDQNRDRNRWVLLGRFHDPLSLKLTNLADGPVVAGSVQFRRVETHESSDLNSQ